MPPRDGMVRSTAMSKGKIILLVTVVLLVVGGVYAAAFYSDRSNAHNAKVGDCMGPAEGNLYAVAPCDGASTMYRVVGRIDGKTKSEMTMDSCDAYQGAVKVYWQGKEGQTGLILCLAVK
jgi:hypothetical protein